ncbi:hypothetical protein [uncultured Maritimibacter sp.]|jgi:uncharacterized protein YjiS (DUF1127 family)|uniref:hypothetical protein n=1 Tax=uncultured Maritimibacter sp. TaxID=991866 RepID=UPI00260B41CE|nr:hypothetical protein [uncultured Maritimibacter sp.]
MSTTIRTPPNAALNPKLTATGQGFAARLVHWVVTADKRFRDREALRRAEAHVLDDMGIARSQIDGFFR